MRCLHRDRDRVSVGGFAGLLRWVAVVGCLPIAAGSRQASPQEVYDDFKLKDELLSGAYANAVMIGHGPHEFCFDFITNFYPQSAVSARVFMAAGHIVRVLESLRTSWEQLKPRLGGPPHER